MLWPVCPRGSASMSPLPSPGPGSPLSGSSFLGPGTFPESFPSTTPSTPTLTEFTPGPPPVSYQSDIPSNLLTPEKSGPCLPGQVSVESRGCGAVPPGSPRAVLLGRSLLPQMAPAGHLDPAHNPGPPGLHAPNLGGPPGPQLHHPNPPPTSRPALGPVNSGPLSELAFSAATGMMGHPVSGAGEAPEPALDVSTGPCVGEHLELGLGGAYLLSPGSVHFIEGKTVTPP